MRILLSVSSNALANTDLATLSYRWVEVYVGRRAWMTHFLL